MIEQILLLGDERLYMVSEDVKHSEVESLKYKIHDLHKAVEEYRQIHGSGRAIAAPQIGLMKRIICFNVDEQITLINPVIHNKSNEKIELWDDCMSFPDLLVKVSRYKKCSITFMTLDWKEVRWDLEDDLSELFQHEYDHLDGILATERAIDKRSFRLKVKESK